MPFLSVLLVGRREGLEQGEEKVGLRASFTSHHLSLILYVINSFCISKLNLFSLGVIFSGPYLSS